MVSPSSDNFGGVTAMPTEPDKLAPTPTYRGGGFCS